MKLVLLGTGGFIPTESAQTACLMLPEVGVLLDAGSGLYRMHPYLQTAGLDIYLSHAHGDHTSGLTYLFASFLVYQINQRNGAVDETSIGELVTEANNRLHAVRVHAAQPAVDFLAKQYDIYQMNWLLLNQHESLPCAGMLTTFSVGHHDEVGFRLDWPGHSLAYVTDTPASPASNYIEKIRGVDVLVHDCNGPDRLKGLMDRIGHSTPAAAARVAALAQVGRLILVHSNPIASWQIDPDQDLEEARALFPEIVIGKDGMEIEF